MSYRYNQALYYSFVMRAFALLAFYLALALLWDVVQISYKGHWVEATMIRCKGAGRGPRRRH